MRKATARGGGDELTERERAAQGFGVTKAKDDVPVPKDVLAQVAQWIITGLVGRGGSAPIDRARVAAGPRKFPCHVGGFIQSVASAASRSVVPSVTIKQ